MKITWIGQGGILLEIGDVKVMVDPFLSNSVEKVNEDFKRMLPIDERYLYIEPEMLICTHNHLDHTDPDTLKEILNCEKPMEVLASKNAWNAIRAMGYKLHNCIQFDSGTEVTLKDIRFKAIKAVHSDDFAIGVVIESKEGNVYITGDTLYNPSVFEMVDKDIDILFVCINGFGNNMNIVDAARFAKKIDAKVTIPIHFGMFEKSDANPEDFIKELSKRKLKGKILVPYEKNDF